MADDSSAGRPAKDPEGPIQQVTLMLRIRNIRFLKGLHKTILVDSDADVNRSEITRGILDAVAECGLKLDGCTSEAEIKAAVMKRLTR